MSSFTLIDTVEKIVDMVNQLVLLPENPQKPSLYLDLEGVNLSRYGSISILQIFVLPLQQTYLVDVHTLQHLAFTTPGTASSVTLKSILESATLPKVLFDVRNDNDALVNLYGINLSNVHDLQLMELAVRNGRKTYVYGLAKAINSDSGLSNAERLNFQACKEAGVALFAPEKGGSYEVFNQRPLPQILQEYCAQDVHFLARLWSIYEARLMGRPHMRAKIANATGDRIGLAKTANYNPKGRDKAIAPAQFK